MPRSLPRLGLSLLAALALALAGAAPAVAQGAAKPSLGLMTTLPLYWPESENLVSLLDPAAPPHWARAELEREFALVPLDVLGELDRFDYLLLAQPRPLSPAENVALDAWVRGGGRLLLFADPMLTGHSIFPIGDRRRPQDVALLSPILAHWGLELRFDESQLRSERQVALGEAGLPVNLPGSLAATGERCTLLAEGLVAQCAIGAGRALVVADAALFDVEGPGRAPALAALTARAFARE